MSLEEFPISGNILTLLVHLIIFFDILYSDIISVLAQMNGVLVFLQVRLLSETRWAKGTLKWPWTLIGVSLHVSDQI